MPIIRNDVDNEAVNNTFPYKIKEHFTGRVADTYNIYKLFNLREYED